MPFGIPSDTRIARASENDLKAVGTAPGVPTRLAVFCIAKKAPSLSTRFATAMQAGSMNRCSKSSMSSSMLIVLNWISTWYWYRIFTGTNCSADGSTFSAGPKVPRYRGGRRTLHVAPILRPFCPNSLSYCRLNWSVRTHRLASTGNARFVIRLMVSNELAKAMHLAPQWGANRDEIRRLLLRAEAASVPLAQAE